MNTTRKKASHGLGGSLGRGVVVALHIIPIALLVGYTMGITFLGAWCVPVLIGVVVLIARRSFYSLVWLGSPFAGLATMALFYGAGDWNWSLDLITLTLVSGVVGLGIMGHGAWKWRSREEDSAPDIPSTPDRSRE